MNQATEFGGRFNGEALDELAQSLGRIEALQILLLDSIDQQLTVSSDLLGSCRRGRATRRGRTISARTRRRTTRRTRRTTGVGRTGRTGRTGRILSLEDWSAHLRLIITHRAYIKRLLRIRARWGAVRLGRSSKALRRQLAIRRLGMRRIRGLLGRLRVWAVGRLRIALRGRRR